MIDYRFPDAQKHSAIEKVFDNIYTVTGSVCIKGPIDFLFSRNMTILKQGEELILVNSIRLTEEGLADLDRLGKVTHVIRLAGFHGMDDPFYKDRYGAEIWSVDAPYFLGVGFQPDNIKEYFKADHIIQQDTQLPIQNSRMFLFDLQDLAEGILLLDKEGGIAVTGDSLQNWATTNEYFNFISKVMMRLMGFIKPYNIGPAWKKTLMPTAESWHKLLEVEFDHLLPSHGENVLEKAKEKYEPVINRAISVVK